MKEQNIIHRLVRTAIWGDNFEEIIDDGVLFEMKQHTIATLMFPALSELNITSKTAEEWKKNIIQQLSYNIQYLYAQENIPITIPYVVLKGTAAAQYYPSPELRTMGDIDIMTNQSDYQSACEMLLQNGYIENTPKSSEALGRHRCFHKYGVEVEIHAFFALLNDPNKAAYLDNLIVSNINSTHVLPDIINGLVILEHINQHLEEGLGLRQVIDWMMFVEKCLPDEKWPEFQKQAQQIGLENLAITITHMCELFLGLPHREWCADADEHICRQLMDYIMLCGNFGNKMISDKDISEKVFAYASSPKASFRLLQDRGLVNWRMARKYKVFRPFAWVYQMCRYTMLGLKRSQAFGKIRAEYLAAKKRRALFDTLGVTTTAKEVYIYKDGKYTKKIINH